MGNGRLPAAAFACIVAAMPGWAALADTPNSASRASSSAGPSLPAAPVSSPSTVGALQKPPAAEQDPIVRAAELFQRAEAKYGEGHLEEALALMEQSYELSQAHDLLFNLGELESELKHCRRAVERYRQYMRQVPNGRRRADAAQAVARLEQECKASPPAGGFSAPRAGASAPPGLSAPPRDSTTLRTVGWAAVGSGVVLGAAAVVFAIAAKHDESDREALNTKPQWTASVNEEANTIENNGKLKQAWAIGLGITAAGAAVGGALLVLLGNPQPQRTPLPVSVGAGPRGVEAAWSVRF
jgi:hypothetical protein